MGPDRIPFRIHCFHIQLSVYVYLLYGSIMRICAILQDSIKYLLVWRGKRDACADTNAIDYAPNCHVSARNETRLQSCVCDTLLRVFWMTEMFLNGSFEWLSLFCSWILLFWDDFIWVLFFLIKEINAFVKLRLTASILFFNEQNDYF